MAQIRNEYPRPQFRRKDWIGLNGEWDFAFDDDRRGLRDGWQNGNILFDKKINVPFTYEFPASGLEEESRHSVVWYRRKVWIKKSNQIKVRCCVSTAAIILRRYG